MLSSYANEVNSLANPLPEQWMGTMIYFPLAQFKSCKIWKGIFSIFDGQSLWGLSENQAREDRSLFISGDFYQPSETGARLR